jgi:hypothetical protein
MTILRNVSFLEERLQVAAFWNRNKGFLAELVKSIYYFPVVRSSSPTDLVISVVVVVV